MNAKSYRVWKVLLEAPHVWISLMDISDKTGLTHKQVVSVVSGLNTGLLERGGCSGDTRIRLKGTKEQIEATRKRVVMDYHGIDQEVIDTLYEHLSPVGWISITDISNDTGLKVNTISAALSIMDDVVKTTSGHTNLYARLM